MNRTVRVFIGAVSIPTLGDWVEVDPYPDTTNEAIAKVAESIAARVGVDAEWAVMDTDDYPGRSSSLSTIQAVVTAAAEIGTDVDAVVAYVEWSGDETDNGYDLAANFQDAYRGTWDSEKEYAVDFAESTASEQIDAAGSFAHYIDWDAYTRDVFIDGAWSAPAPSGRVYVFSN